MGKGSTNPKYQKYLNNKTRIKNKTIKMEKRLKTIKEEKTRNKILEVGRIGRKKEGFKTEQFKCKPPKKPVFILEKNNAKRKN
jgi:hypothetical protein